MFASTRRPHHPIRRFHDDTFPPRSRPRPFCGNKACLRSARSAETGELSAKYGAHARPGTECEASDPARGMIISRPLLVGTAESTVWRLMTDRTAIDAKDELMLLYQVTVSDLAYFKSTQWTVSNYVFLLLGATAGARQLLGADADNLERSCFAGLAVSIGIAGLMMLFKLNQSITIRERRLDAVREQMSPEFKAAWRAGTKGPEYFRAIWFLVLANILGAAIVAWLCHRV